MFEPEYTEAMSSVLDMLDKFGDLVLPEDKVNEKVLSFLKRGSKVTDELPDSSDMEVCMGEKITTCVTPCFAYKDTDTYEGEDESASEHTDVCCRDD